MQGSQDKKLWLSSSSLSRVSPSPVTVEQQEQDQVHHEIDTRDPEAQQQEGIDQTNDTTRDPEAQQQEGIDDNNETNDSNNNSEQGGSSGTIRQFRRRKCALVTGILMLVVIVVVSVSIWAVGQSTGSSSSSSSSSRTNPDHRLIPRPSGTTTKPQSPRPETVSWKQLGARLNGEADGDRFGGSVALSADGTTMAVSAPYFKVNGVESGRVLVFRYDTSKDRWNPLGAALNGDASGDRFGRSIALSADGTILAVGAPYNGERTSGQVRVFEYNTASGQWNQLGADVNGEAAYDRSGMSVALSKDGKVLAVGAPSYRSDSGHVRLFRRDSASDEWIQLGSDLYGEDADDEWFGWSVALSADGAILAVGSKYGGRKGSLLGNARVFRFSADDNDWNQLGTNLDSEAADSTWPGWVVALSSDGKILAVGGPRNEEQAIGDRTGQVRVFEYNSASDQWSQLGAGLDGEAAYDSFGISVALSSDGTVLAVGAPGNDGIARRSLGHARVFQYDKANESWNRQLGGDLNGKAADDQFGSSVALSADGRIVAGGTDQKSGQGYVKVFQRHSGTPHGSSTICSLLSLTGYQCT